MVVFNFLWAASVVIHIWNRSRGFGIDLGLTMTGVISTVTFLVALVLMVWPGSVRLLCAFAAIQLIHVVVDLPYTADHWVLMAFVDVLILLSAAKVGGADKDARLAALWDDLGPSVRLIFVICYAAAPLSKINSGFFDPAVSCGTLFESILGQLVPIPPFGRYVIIGTTLLAEGGIALGVLIPRMRSNAIRLALLFHFFVSLLPVIRVFDFSVVVFASMLFFAPPDVTDRLRARWIPFAAAFPVFQKAQVRRGLGIAMAIATAVFVVVIAPHLDVHVSVPLTFIVFTCFGVFVVYNGLRSVGAPQPNTSGRPYFGLSRRSHAAVLVIAIITVVSPYVGLKTAGVFTMFSNLRTEQGETNHYFLPSVSIFGYQDDLVEVVSSNDEVLASLKERQLLVPFEALRRQVGEGTGIEVTYLRGGETVTHTPEKPAPGLTPLGHGLDSWLLFRPIPKEGQPPCTN